MRTISKTVNCYHCNTPINDERDVVLGEISGKRESFCCAGCKTLATLLVSHGLTQFYALRGSERLEPIQETKERDENLEIESVYEEYVNKLENGYYETLITIGKIHCSACVWLNEKVLSAREGVREVRINFATGRMKLTYDRKLITLDEIFSLIRSIGYEPSLYSPLKAEKSIGVFSKDIFYRMAVAGFSWGNIMLFSVGLYTGYFSGIEAEFKKLFHYVSWIFATPAYLYAGYPFYKGAVESIKRKMLTMDTLLFSGVSLAYFYSVYVTLTDRGEVYFDSVCTIYFFILIGKFLESAIRLKAGRKVGELLSTLPQEYSVLSVGKEIRIAPGKIQRGDRLILKNGNRVPVDGIVRIPQAYFDESFLTGESEPVVRKQGDPVLSGSICLSSNAEIEATTTAKESTLSRISALIETSLQAKPKLQRTTDRFSAHFIRVVIAIAIATFCIFGFYKQDWEAATLNTISVLIVACPCALGLAVPAAYVVGNLMHGTKGILVKNPDSMEILSRATRIYFDKTGTLTSGKLAVRNEWFSEPKRKNEFYSLVYSLESASSHPLAESLKREITLKERPDRLTTISWKEIREIPGAGMEGTVASGESYRVGSLGFVSYGTRSSDGKVYLGKKGELLASFSLEDTVRPEAKAALQRLKERIPYIEILSGDSKSKVQSLASTLDLERYSYELKPEDKLAVIQKSQKEGETVVMVGDGINDSACLAAADLGISMGIASDLSIDKSDLVLISNRLDSLAAAAQISRKTKRIIIQNILISLSYNSIMLPLAAFGFMLPVICAGFMTLSSLTVVLNSISLSWRTKI
ncbi:cadmium-translocating P-type ATPase [Leptospira gomenensis]|uniref:Cadmium-translocating P-type ATPase n=1 Tax=Leptospira gomenensis TaxID=2484974 RepID=A0A5F1YE70_9LEPT|nr:heavy metal translocating P-type ATPase [Leptospira gomenensis]TGK37428.1 cadmium-translocating P-type ATPase [Leptospira gomenensis]TGK40787.1 cadmium-translocating P-type ATPase [Leptospira gomenensis]TGK43013.1 cadmium-translocating P-type ATPase [Leptospira gomenensis]TGK54287.1 cadmium-translocating P-type ATPase [Leptospira gomenensis]